MVKPEGQLPLGRLSSRWDDTIKNSVTEIGRGMDWINVAHDRDWWQVWCEHSNESLHPSKCGERGRREGFSHIADKLLTLKTDSAPCSSCA